MDCFSCGSYAYLLMKLYQHQQHYNGPVSPELSINLTERLSCRVSQAKSPCLNKNYVHNSPEAHLSLFIFFYLIKFCVGFVSQISFGRNSSISYIFWGFVSSLLVTIRKLRFQLSCVSLIQLFLLIILITPRTANREF